MYGSSTEEQMYPLVILRLLQLQREYLAIEVLPE